MATQALVPMATQALVPMATKALHIPGSPIPPWKPYPSLEALSIPGSPIPPYTTLEALYHHENGGIGPSYLPSLFSTLNLYQEEKDLKNLSLIENSFFVSNTFKAEGRQKKLKKQKMAKF